MRQLLIISVLKNQDTWEIIDKQCNKEENILKQTFYPWFRPTNCLLFDVVSESSRLQKSTYSGKQRRRTVTPQKSNMTFSFLRQSVLRSHFYYVILKIMLSLRIAYSRIDFGLQDYCHAKTNAFWSLFRAGLISLWLKF